MFCHFSSLLISVRTVLIVRSSSHFPFIYQCHYCFHYYALQYLSTLVAFILSRLCKNGPVFSLETRWQLDIKHNVMSLSCSVTEIVTSSPVGMQLTPLRHDALQGIFYRNITWYPSQYQVGQQLFCFKAKDSAGYLSWHLLYIQNK